MIEMFKLRGLFLVLILLIPITSANLLDDLKPLYWSDEFLSLEGVSGPGIYVQDLPRYQGDTSDIEEILRSYEFTKTFKLNEFDCSDMAQRAFVVLQDHGYKTKLMLDFIDEFKTYHCWLVVEVEPNQWLAVECLSENRTEIKDAIGRPIYKDIRYSGAMFNSTTEMWIYCDDRFKNKPPLNPNWPAPNVAKVIRETA